MSSFEKKLSNLLELATERKVITRQDADNLQAFMQSDEYQHKGWLTLSGSMGGLGALIVCFGIILIIANNWHMFSDLAKITGFLILLGSCHFTGLYLARKGYDKSSQALHFCGAGLIIAGIGLIGQIFHLHSYKGEAFLTWAGMIAPLAILLRNGPIALLSVIAFAMWGNIYMLHMLPNNSWLTIFAFNTALCITSAMAGLVLKQRNSAIAPFLQTPGMIGVICSMYLFGFSHNFSYIRFSYGNLIMPFLTLLPAIALGMYLLLTNQTNKALRYLIIALGSSIVTILLILFAFVVGVHQYGYIEYLSFGWTKHVYYLPLLISVSAWVAYFGLAFWGVIYGALNQKRQMLNSNITLIGIGIFTRFIDLVGKMLDTGLMFVICGLVLFAIGFALEKWRRKLIARTQQSGEWK